MAGMQLSGSRKRTYGEMKGNPEQVRRPLGARVLNEMNSQPPEAQQQDVEVIDEVPPPKHPLLESVSQRFQIQRQERLQKIEDIKAQCQQERSHAAHLRNSIASQQEMNSAAHVVASWTSKNALNSNKGAGNAAWLETVRQNQAKIQFQVSSSSAPPVPSIAVIRPSSHKPGQVQDARLAPEANPPLAAPDDDVIEILDETDNSVIIVEEEEDQSERGAAGSHQTCPILSCGAEFSSKDSLKQHMNNFSHSPCNPLLKIVDLKCHTEPLSYICPTCLAEYQSRELCAHHMLHEKHLWIYPPYAVRAYLCPQCLCLFNSYGHCWQHIEMAAHNHPALPFKDDKQHGSPGIDPVPMCEEHVADYLRRCQAVSFKVQCLECSVEADNPTALQHHIDETNGRHLISSLTDTTLMDVFTDYMATYYCSFCKRLCTEVQKKETVHRCAERVYGVVERNSTSSFKEFVIRCGLTLTKSQPSEVYNVRSSYTRNNPPPSRRTPHTAESVDRFQNKENPGLLSVPEGSSGRFKNLSGETRSRPKSRWDNLDVRDSVAYRPRSHTRSRSRERVASPRRDWDRPSPDILDTENLSTMINILFLDLDNWPGFFTKLPKCLPHKTFVWGFFGGAMQWVEPSRCFVFNEIKRSGCFHLHDKCGRTKDAADFAIVLTVGKMDAVLPKRIPFTIVSGDRGFVEVERQMKISGRKAVVIDPHSAQKFSNYTVFTMVTSVTDT